MSTILKALKKLEQETQSAAAAARLPSMGDETAAGPQPGRRARLWIGIGIGTSLLGLGLALFLLLRPADPPAVDTPQSPPARQTPPEKVKAPGRELTMPKVFPPRQPGDPEKTTSDPVRTTDTARYAAGMGAAGADLEGDAVPQTGASSGQSSPVPTAAEPAGQANPPASEAKARPESGSQRAEKAVVAPAAPSTPPAPADTAAGVRSAASQAAHARGPMKAAPVEEPPVTKPNSQAPPASGKPPAMKVEALADPFANVPRMEENSPIQLQAISWAQSAEKRIAVINNRVLHEGDSVEGYTVVKIRPDDVVLRRDGRMWRAKF